MAKVNNISKWKMVERHCTGHRVWGGSFQLTPYYYEEITEVWEIHLQDGAVMPATEANPGGYETGRVEVDGQMTAAYSWYCADRSMTRDYSAPLSTVYRETWCKRTKTTEM